ncbi:AbrB/MazE/SpoVT family DNA-binding domain-containing protein [Candidatus Bathyarchaeota archaeon]|nr:AbrB/MazE/SpoVT family DNA-binding domain-containing protein [Candidatus Bathyarchaeota archaeon]
MTAKTRRKIVKIGPSSFVSLPADWMRGMRLKNGDEVDVFYDGIVVVVPKNAPIDAGLVRRELDRIISIL